MNFYGLATLGIIATTLSNIIMPLDLNTLADKKVFKMTFDEGAYVNEITNKSYSQFNENGTIVPSSKNMGYKPNGSFLMIPTSDLSLTSSDSTVTISFLMNWDGTDNSFMPVGFGTFCLWMYSGYFGFNTGVSDIYGLDNPFTVGKTYHITAVFNTTDITKCELYIDGVKQTLSQKLKTPNLTNAKWGTQLGIGTWANNSNGTNDGFLLKGDTIIDEVQVFKGGVTAKEAQELSKEQTIPELNVTAKTNSVDLAWATEIINPIWDTSYEIIDQPNIQLVYNATNGKGDGGQYFDNTTSYGGNYSLYTPKTNGGYGNWVIPPKTSNNSNHVYYRNKKFSAKNGERISISYRSKSSKDMTVRIMGNWVYEKRVIPLGITLVENATKGSKILKVSDASKFYFDMALSFSSDPTDNTYIPHIREINLETNEITLSRGIPFDISNGFERNQSGTFSHLFLGGGSPLFISSEIN